MAKKETQEKEQKERKNNTQGKPQKGARKDPQKGARKDPQKKARGKEGKQEDRWLMIVCTVIVAAVVVLLAVFFGRQFLGSGDAENDAETGTEQTAAAGDEETEAGETAAETENGETEPEAGEQADAAALAAAIADPIYADITIEGYGTVTVALDASAAPVTVENFVSLAEEGFYDGLTFHRIIDGFMMQGGDPEGTGLGGSDEEIVGEFSDNGYDNPLTHIRGAISMARSQDPDSASSQFFIVQSDSTFLDGQYAVFGYVTSGMEYVDQICKDAQPTDDNGSIAPEDQPVITSVVIRREE